MSDDSNVTPLRPGRGRGRGGSEPPGLPPLPGAPPDPPATPSPPPSAPPPDEGSGAELVPGRRRRSAAESLAALTATPPVLPPARQEVLATFRGEGLDDRTDVQRPGLGALSLSAILAVALAALRGTAGAIQDWRQRRLERAAEAEPLRRARLKLQEARLGTDTALAGGSSGKGGRVPSSHDWGRKAHGGGGGSPGGGGKHGKGPHARSGSGTGPSHTSKSPSSGRSGPHGSHGTSSTGSPSSSGTTGKHGKPGAGHDGSAAGGKSGKARPGTLGQLALDQSQRRTARQAAEDKQAARQQKADLAAGTAKAGKDGSADGKTGEKDGRKPDGDGGDGRVTFGKAVGGEWVRRAWKRWEARRENPDPPFLRRDRKDAAAEDADGTEAGGEKDTGETADDASAGPDGAGDGTGEWAPPPRGERRSAADGVAEEVVITVERADRPGDAARGREPGPAEPVVPAAITTGVRGLPRAPYRPAGPRPGTTRPGRTARVPSMTKEARMSAPVPSVRMPGGGLSPAPEHMTEVTLDDVLHHLKGSKLNCFVTYDECARLAGKAREIRRHLDELAADLAQYHNVIGRLTSAAMARLAESMDLLARKAEEMRTESLKAAESVEVAHDEMHDAYKPVQQAAADAGLSTPSARIHNED